MEKIYTTDNKVIHLSSDQDINQKLGNIIGKKFVDYRKKWDLVHEKFLETDFPLFLQIHPNQSCNYSCPHCLLGNDAVKKNYNEKSLSQALYKRIVDEGSEYKCPSISIQGWNEPLYMKKIFDYIRYAHDKNFIDIMLNSNGSLLDENKIKQILDSGLTRIRFSMDAATEETYRKVRLEQGFDSIKKNIARLVELRDKGNYKLPLVGVSFCQISTNIHEKQLFIDTWSEIVDFVSIQTFLPPVHDAHYDQFYIDNHEKHNLIPDNFKCPQPFERVDIHGNEIFPCCYYDSKNLSLGNIEKISIYEAWNSNKAKYIRDVHREGDYSKIVECTKCVKSTFGRI